MGVPRRRAIAYRVHMSEGAGNDNNLAGTEHGVVDAARINRFLEGRLKLRQLRLLVAVADHGSILRASQALNMTQPGATKSIQELEADLEVPLFDRSSQGATPTEYGAALIARARIVLSELRGADAELSALREGAIGHVSIGAALTVTPSLVPLALAEIKRDRPQLSVSVVESTNDLLIPMLRKGDLDIVVGRLPEAPDDRGLRPEVLFHEPIRIVARRDHPLSRKRRLSSKDLSQAQWILPFEGTSLRQKIETTFKDAGLSMPTEVVESVSITINLALLAASDMVAAMPAQVVESSAEFGSVRALPINPKWDFGPVGIVTRASRPLPRAGEILLDVLRRQAADLNSNTVKQRRGKN